VSRFNISEWALRHPSFVLFLMLAFVLVGVNAYRKLGREEDPSFAIKTMIIGAEWPGATIADTLDQITDRRSTTSGKRNSSARRTRRFTWTFLSASSPG
jgi:multidrug efflux pump